MYQARYVAYAKANGKTPEQMLAHDAVEFPGGKMCGFVCWISARWTEWRKANGVERFAGLSQADHDSFDQFISA